MVPGACGVHFVDPKRWSIFRGQWFVPVVCTVIPNSHVSASGVLPFARGAKRSPTPGHVLFCQIFSARNIPLRKLVVVSRSRTVREEGVSDLSSRRRPGSWLKLKLIVGRQSVMKFSRGC